MKMGQFIVCKTDQHTMGVFIKYNTHISKDITNALLSERVKILCLDAKQSIIYIMTKKIFNKDTKKAYS